MIVRFWNPTLWLWKFCKLLHTSSSMHWQTSVMQVCKTPGPSLVPIGTASLHTSNGDSSKCLHFWKSNCHTIIFLLFYVCAQNAVVLWRLMHKIIIPYMPPQSYHFRVSNLYMDCRVEEVPDNLHHIPYDGKAYTRTVKKVWKCQFFDIRNS